MRSSRPDDPIRSFFAGLPAASARVLVLDFDGTLAPFVEDRLRAVPYDGVPERLSAIMDSGTRVVVVSGRPLVELEQLIPVEPLPELWGSHGWERRLPGSPGRAEALGRREAQLLVEAAAAATAVLPDERVELKPTSVAVHVRGLPERAARLTLERVRGAWHDVSASGRLQVEPFDGGVEARVSGHDKGTAVLRVLSEEPDDAQVAYLGDDRTDEDAFRALHGKALTLLVRVEPRPTAADAHLVPPGELLAFFDDWIRVTAGGNEMRRGTTLAPPRHRG